MTHSHYTRPNLIYGCVTLKWNFWKVGSHGPKILSFLKFSFKKAPKSTKLGTFLMVFFFKFEFLRVDEGNTIFFLGLSSSVGVRWGGRGNHAAIHSMLLCIVCTSALVILIYIVLITLARTFHFQKGWFFFGRTIFTISSSLNLHERKYKNLAYAVWLSYSSILSPQNV